MSTTPLVLYIELKPDTKINLKVAARAAIAWAEMVERTGAHLDPLNTTTIELEASEAGSQIIKAIIRTLTENPKETVKIAIVTSLLFVAKTTVAWGWEQVLEFINGPDAPAEVRSLSKEEMESLAREVAAVVLEGLAEKPKNRIYEELAADENVTGVGMSSSMNRKPQVIVTRKEFPIQVYEIEGDGFQKRSRVEETDLVLLKPVLTDESNKRWGFSWAYGKFGATIKDTDFLDRMSAGQMNVPMAQGIIFKVELEIVEEKRDQVWQVKEYAILRVIAVSPPQRQPQLPLH